MIDAVDLSRWLWADRRRRFCREAARPNLGGCVEEVIDVGEAEIRVLSARQPGASKSTLVIVPDPPNVIEQYLPLIDQLARRYRVVCFENPGFGGSYVKPGFRFDIRSYCNAYDELFARLGILDAVLDMACLGGFAGLAFASGRPDRVRHLMLQQTPSLAEAKLWARRADLFGVIRTPFIGQMFMRCFFASVTKHWYKSALPRTSEGADEAREMTEPALALLARGGCFCLCNAYQSLLATSVSARTSRPRKTTVVWGGADATHRDTTPASLRDDVPGAEFVLFDSCGHFPMLEEPARYISMLCEALDRE